MLTIGFVYLLRFNLDCSMSELITTCRRNRACNIIWMEHSLMKCFIISETTQRKLFRTPGALSAHTHTLWICVDYVLLMFPCSQLLFACRVSDQFLPIFQTVTQTDGWIDRTILAISSNPGEKLDWSAVCLSDSKSNSVCAGVRVFEICRYSNVFSDFWSPR